MTMMTMPEEDQHAKMMKIFNRTAHDKDSSKQRERRQAQDGERSLPNPSSTRKKTTQPVTGKFDDCDRSNNDQTAETVTSSVADSSSGGGDQCDIDVEFLLCDEHQDKSARSFELSALSMSIPSSGSSPHDERWARQSLRFIDDETGGSVVTESHTRPRTESCDMGTLYYNASDFEEFREKYIDDSVAKAALHIKLAAPILVLEETDKLDKPVRDGQRPVQARLMRRQGGRRNIHIDRSLTSSFIVPNVQLQ